MTLQEILKMLAGATRQPKEQLPPTLADFRRRMEVLNSGTIYLTTARNNKEGL